MRNNHVELAPRAVKDLRRIDKPDLVTINLTLKSLADASPPDILDVVPLADHHPWRRLRVGSHRILFRPMTEDELRDLEGRGIKLEGPRGFLVARIVHRRDLEKAVRNL